MKTFGIEETPRKSLLRNRETPETNRKSPAREKKCPDLEEELLLALRCIRRVIHENDKRAEDQEHSDSLKREWHDLAHVIDRLFLVIFLIINGCLIIALAVLNNS
jgi:hypothetical protein